MDLKLEVGQSLVSYHLSNLLLRAYSAKIVGHRHPYVSSKQEIQ